MEEPKKDGSCKEAHKHQWIKAGPIHWVGLSTNSQKQLDEVIVAQVGHTSY